ncbi:hypothetical protein LZK98_04580 [Sphingomonas cannabina]|uniref:hypothetical protein n=1 Tax=Sphingomonas cannabina TaxID=2899123 RepID=UPI001F3B00E1|nr:hypothetical protein [Sphingomonas cannabina]UIJ46228.1 hypothetical protein LZK98_04580 [Sphingomonas cannabina]
MRHPHYLHHPLSAPFCAGGSGDPQDRLTPASTGISIMDVAVKTDGDYADGSADMIVKDIKVYPN